MAAHASKEVSCKNHESADQISPQVITVISSSTRPAQGMSVFATSVKNDDKAPIKKSVLRDRDHSSLTSHSLHSHSRGHELSPHNESPTKLCKHPRLSFPHYTCSRFHRRDRDPLSCSQGRDHSPGALNSCVTNHSLPLLLVVHTPILINGNVIKTRHLLILQNSMLPRC